MAGLILNKEIMLEFILQVVSVLSILYRVCDLVANPTSSDVTLRTT